jgi:hypothetical protein
VWVACSKCTIGKPFVGIVADDGMARMRIPRCVPRAFNYASFALAPAH